MKYRARSFPALFPRIRTSCAYWWFVTRSNHWMLDTEVCRLDLRNSPNVLVRLTSGPTINTNRLYARGYPRAGELDVDKECHTLHTVQRELHRSALTCTRRVDSELMQP